MEFVIPQSLKLEHEELHAELAEATKAGGTVSKAAKAVERVLHPHFVKEEEYALPPLGLLCLLAEGRITADMRAAITMTNRLKAGTHPRIVQERLGHSSIATTLDIYSHTVPGLQKAAAERFDTLLPVQKMSAKCRQLVMEMRLSRVGFEPTAP